MPDTKLYKMSGAGNDFVVLDGRGVDASEFRRWERIREVCSEFRTDGLMILEESAEADFSMDFYNPDGSGGMMCGNGGRCIAAFADWLGITPSAPDRYTFLAPDGPHVAEILSRPTGEASQWTVRLQMIDVDGVQEVLGGYFLNTGTRHFVMFVEDVDAIDVAEEGKALRWNEAFAPEGANINFVQVCGDYLKIRTFEKGVEGETLACGTGITAAALATWFAHCGGNNIHLQARRGDILTVDFVPAGPASFRKIHLTGPAEFV